jgi:hypothetical protein
MKRHHASGAVLLGIGSAYLGLGWAGFWAPLLFPAIALAAYAVVAVAARVRWPVALVGPATAVVFSVGPVVLAASRTGADPLTTARDLVPRLLSHPYPAPSTVELLAPGAVLVAVMAVGVAGRVVQPGGGRLAPSIAVAVLYVAGAVLSGGRADRHGLVAAALLAAALADWLVEEAVRPRGPEPAERPGAGAIVRQGASRSLPVLVPAAVVVLLTALTPVDTAFEPRAVVYRPVQLLAEPNPLPLMTQWARNGATVLMRVRAEQPVALRLVALTDYTGDGWHATGGYGPVGADDLDPAAASLPPGRHRTAVDIEVTLAVDLDTRWLPTPGITTATSMPDALVQPMSGVLARLEPSPAGFRYRVRADVNTPAPADLAAAAVPLGPSVARYLDLPGLPMEFANLAGSAAAGACRPVERAVVVGFQPAERDQDGLWVVRGRDAMAWPEVYLIGAGWVAFDPRPRTLSGG